MTGEKKEHTRPRWPFAALMEALLLRVVDGDLDAVEAYLKYNGDPNAVFMHRGRHHSLLEVAAASGPPWS